MRQEIDILFKCPCQVYCGVYNDPNDRPTVSISTSVALLYIRGSRWPYGLGVCLEGHGFDSRAGTFNIFLSGHLLCGMSIYIV